MTVHDFSNKNSILNKFISEIRDENLQKDSLRFRRNIERIGEVLGYEMSRTFNYESKNVTTPLGVKNIEMVHEELVLCSILRAGLPLHNGLLNYFDDVENAFVSAYRKHTSEREFTIEVEYLAAPSFDGKTLILADPMLATGRSLVETYNAMLKNGVPKQIHIMAVIGSDEGISYIKNHFPENTHLWIATVDESLNDKGYIVPGLGDAGDLAYGPKL